LSSEKYRLEKGLKKGKNFRAAKKPPQTFGNSRGERRGEILNEANGSDADNDGLHFLSVQKSRQEGAKGGERLKSSDTQKTGAKGAINKLTSPVKKKASKGNASTQKTTRRRREVAEVGVHLLRLKEYVRGDASVAMKYSRIKRIF